MSNNFSIALLALASVLALPHAQALSGDNDNLEHTKDSLEKVKELVEHKKAILLPPFFVSLPDECSSLL